MTRLRCPRRSPRYRRLVRLGGLCFGLACGAEGGGAEGGTRPDAGGGARPAVVGGTGLAGSGSAHGGRALPGASGALLAAERSRDPEGVPDPAAAPTPGEQVAMLASLARIGDRTALARALPLLDGRYGLPPHGLAAFGLFDSPPLAPSSALAPKAPAEPGNPFVAAERALWLHHVLAEDRSTWDATGFALARVGGSATADLLAADVAEAATAASLQPGRVEADLRAMGHLCRRGWAADRTWVDAAVQALDGEDDPVREAALDVLARCLPVSPDAVEPDRARAVASRVEAVLEGATAPVAAAGFRALRALSIPPEVAADEVFAPWPGPARTRVPGWVAAVERVRALGVTKPGRETIAAALHAIPEAALVMPMAHVVAEALVALRRAEAAEVGAMVAAVDDFRRRLRSRQAKGRAARVRAHLACEADLTLAALGQALAGVCDAPALPAERRRRARVERWALAPEGPARLRALKALAAEQVPAVAAAAVAALGSADPDGAEATVRGALASGDPGVAAAAAQVLAAWRRRGHRLEPATAAALARAAASIPDTAGWVEARLGVAEALAAVAEPDGGAGGRSRWTEEGLTSLAASRHRAVRAAAAAGLSAVGAPVPPAPSFAFEPAGDRIAVPLVRPWGLRVVTDAGTFEVSLAWDTAPMNAANLAAIAREGGFDGLSFHRVVPGFVVQGGDPRGDGYGGPGYVVPCEWSNLRYGRGSVGMALAGKDTGGSQFFVTQVPAPHLDGRYTVVGTVRRGLDVIDRILPGDRIGRVEVLGGPTAETGRGDGGP